MRSPSFERNAEPILGELRKRLNRDAGTVLEIGSGSGQHAAFFAEALAPLTWLPTDPQTLHLRSIEAWRQMQSGESLAAPVRLDARRDWSAMPEIRDRAPLAGVYSQNVIHIADWDVCEGLVAGAARCLQPGGKLMLYGPFIVAGEMTGAGNRTFHASLKAQDPDWGLRDTDDVAALAKQHGFGRTEIVPMPSDNRMLFFDRLA